MTIVPKEESINVGRVSRSKSRPVVNVTNRPPMDVEERRKFNER